MQKTRFPQMDIRLSSSKLNDKWNNRFLNTPKEASEFAK